MKWARKYLWQLKTDHLENIVKCLSIAGSDYGLYKSEHKQMRDKYVKAIKQELELRKHYEYLAFFRAYYNNPYEECIRLVWADWCYDNGLFEHEKELRDSCNVGTS